MMRAGSPFLAAVALALCGCVATPMDDGGASTPPDGEHGYSQATAAECAVTGGTYARRGLLGQYSCAVPFADAGEVCTKASDCIGQCRVENGEATSGTCQATNDPFGCYSYLDEASGKPVSICVD